jgi:hypothetical protein
MATERAFACGGIKYYIVEKYGKLFVERQGWLGRELGIRVANDREAFEVMQKDAHSSKVEPR